MKSILTQIILAGVVVGLSAASLVVNSIEIRSSQFVDLNTDASLDSLTVFTCTAQSLFWSPLGQLTVEEVEWEVDENLNGRIHYQVSDPKGSGFVTINLTDKETIISLQTESNSFNHEVLVDSVYSSNP